MSPASPRGGAAQARALTAAPCSEAPESSAASERAHRAPESGEWLVAPDSDPEELFALVYRQVVSLSCESGAALDDLVQMAFEQVLKALPRFRGQSQLSTFTYGICYKSLLKQRRWYARWLKRFTLTHDGELPDPHHHLAPSASESLEQFERHTRLRRAIQSLPTKRRAAVVLCDLEGMDVNEVARALDAKPATVRSRLRDGRCQLAELLRRDPYFGASDAHEVTSGRA